MKNQNKSISESKSSKEKNPNPQNTDTQNINSTYYEEITEKIKEIRDHMLNKHSKVFTLRCDVRFPNIEHCLKRKVKNHTTEIMCDFNARFMKTLKKEGLDPKYIWVRENANKKYWPDSVCFPSSDPHYHYILFLNGHKVQNPTKIMKKANMLFNRVIKAEPVHVNIGLVHMAESIMLRKDSPSFEEDKEKAMQYWNYLAKKRTKENTPANYHKYGASLIKERGK